MSRRRHRPPRGERGPGGRRPGSGEARANVEGRSGAGEEFEVEVERILPGGVGLAHAGGRTVFVALAAPGGPGTLHAFVVVLGLQSLVAVALVIGSRALPART